VIVDFTGFDKAFRLAGKVALITGAAQGIGKAIAELYAEKGAAIVLVDMSESVHEAAATLTAVGADVMAVTADLTVTSNIDKVVAAALERFGKVDILVNNAGIALLDDATDLSEAMWDATMAINLKAPFLLSQAVGREMIRAGGGRIVNLASQAGVVALDRHVAYCSSKAAIIQMTKVLALEWAKHGITVNAISPTVVLTELGKKAWADQAGEDMKRAIPVGRFAHPEEIAAAALFLASDAADMITGANLLIDGGYTIQ
jgi:glycerol dehydrogenase